MKRWDGRQLSQLYKLIKKDHEQGHYALRNWIWNYKRITSYNVEKKFEEKNKNKNKIQKIHRTRNVQPRSTT